MCNPKNTTRKGQVVLKDIDAFVTSMKEGDENFILTDEGDIDKFLGIE